DLGSETGSDGFGEALTDGEVGAEPERERPAAPVSPLADTSAADDAGLGDLDIGFDLHDDEPVTPAADAAGDEGDFDFLSDADEIATKLELARAYIDIGDAEGARDILDEVLQAGS